MSLEMSGLFSFSEKWSWIKLNFKLLQNEYRGALFGYGKPLTLGRGKEIRQKITDILLLLKSIPRNPRLKKEDMTMIILEAEKIQYHLSELINKFDTKKSEHENVAQATESLKPNSVLPSYRMKNQFGSSQLSSITEKSDCTPTPLSGSEVISENLKLKLSVHGKTTDLDHNSHLEVEEFSQSLVCNQNTDIEYTQGFSQPVKRLAESHEDILQHSKSTKSTVYPNSCDLMNTSISYKQNVSEDYVCASNLAADLKTDTSNMKKPKTAQNIQFTSGFSQPVKRLAESHENILQHSKSNKSTVTPNSCDLTNLGKKDMNTSVLFETNLTQDYGSMSNITANLNMDTPNTEKPKTAQKIQYPEFSRPVKRLAESNEDILQHFKSNKSTVTQNSSQYFINLSNLTNLGKKDMNTSVSFDTNLTSNLNTDTPKMKKPKTVQKRTKKPKIISNISSSKHLRKIQDEKGPTMNKDKKQIYKQFDVQTQETPNIIPATQTQLIFQNSFSTENESELCTHISETENNCTRQTPLEKNDTFTQFKMEIFIQNEAKLEDKRQIKTSCLTNVEYIRTVTLGELMPRTILPDSFWEQECPDYPKEWASDFDIN